jgi:hypothetical protein
MKSTVAAEGGVHSDPQEGNGRSLHLPPHETDPAIGCICDASREAARCSVAVDGSARLAEGSPFDVSSLFGTLGHVTPSPARAPEASARRSSPAVIRNSSPSASTRERFLALIVNRVGPPRTRDVGVGVPRVSPGVRR